MLLDAENAAGPSGGTVEPCTVPSSPRRLRGGEGARPEDSEPDDIGAAALIVVGAAGQDDHRHIAEATGDEFAGV